jgi:hypothetical protein
MRAPHNMRPLENYPNLLRDLDKLEDPFLSALTNLENHTLTKKESASLSLMLFESALDIAEAEADLPMITTQMIDLPTISPMEQTSRTTSPSYQSMTLRLWDPSLKSSIETEPELMHSLQNS